jgi:predicted LPLAT superfamily acyltransferase
MSQEWVAGRERSNTVAMNLLVWVALNLGRSIGRALLYPICAYFLIFSVKSRKASRKYLSLALGRPPRMSDVFRHYHTFAAMALDRPLLLGNKFEQLEVSAKGEEVLLESIARGESCFLLGAHLGSFEALRTLGRQRHVKINVLMFEDSSPRVNAIVRKLNPALGAEVISMGSLDSMLELRERVGRGEWIGMLGDRMLGKVGHIQADFFGVPAFFPTAPFRIAGLLGKPVILMVGLYRGGSHYELCFERLVDKPDFKHGNRDQILEEWVRRYAVRLEHYCREEPYNWFNFYDFWAHPSGEDAESAKR